MSITFRRATNADREFIRQMNLETETWGDPTRELGENWRADEVRYVDHWSEDQGGVIAEAGVEDDDGADPQAAALGAAWLRSFTAEDPGHGFLSEDYPEVAIALSPASTGKGIGRTLMTKTLDLARELGAPGVSLCVEDGNDRAKHLYESIGFEHVRRDSTGSYFVMLYRF
ncbi:GNAT family N-acetyltransferase [Corynebacterium sp. 320]|uniref:GNAT family N-acetyltransferase n=1 Tax=Corynebacterium TaxID=1716 RepID=UPI00125CCA43|nr:MULTISPECIES: N-acetyltransferase [Corynebacterium]KAB1502854.1 GNAT family N-acetyltransferase [Corynebacterium sp. 320]KAB1552365.1 GNAT family N-acetyltransferase [Corynebacterium sp. 321]KAB1554420.1 GNAT family N-acetyltransferase [Corynebacterium sp. 319]KAB3526517.1 GNAT family N-acetyltransferase [Corynebacterium sp. 250]KAB3539837.1 GNAT family N-acetyltransferase [Corynebacterium sp. 366]